MPSVIITERSGDSQLYSPGVWKCCDHTPHCVLSITDTCSQSRALTMIHAMHWPHIFITAFFVVSFSFRVSALHYPVRVDREGCKLYKISSVFCQHSTLCTCTCHLVILFPHRGKYYLHLFTFTSSNCGVAGVLNPGPRWAFSVEINLFQVPSGQFDTAPGYT